MPQEWIHWYGTEGYSDLTKYIYNPIVSYGPDFIFVYQTQYPERGGRYVINRITSKGVVLWTTILDEPLINYCQLFVNNGKILLQANHRLIELNPSTGTVQAALDYPPFFTTSRWVGYVDQRYILDFRIYSNNLITYLQPLTGDFGVPPGVPRVHHTDYVNGTTYSHGLSGSPWLVISQDNVTPRIYYLDGDAHASIYLKKDSTAPIYASALTPDGGFVFVTNDTALAIDGNSWRVVKCMPTGNIVWTVALTNVYGVAAIATDGTKILLCVVSHASIGGADRYGMVCLGESGTFLWSRKFANPGLISYGVGEEGLCINNGMGYYLGSSYGPGPSGTTDMFISAFNLNPGDQSLVCSLFTEADFVVTSIPEPTYASHWSSAYGAATTGAVAPTPITPGVLSALTYLDEVLCETLSLELTAVYSCEAAPPLGAVIFHVVASGGTPPYTYLWNFGDGSTGSGANPEHTYSGLGPYLAQVTVTDSMGETATGTIEVGCPVLNPDNSLFIDCPSFTREQALEMPITDTDKSYTAKNASVPFNENVLYTVYSRHPSLAPFLGSAPTFSDFWNNDDTKIKKSMCVWLNPVDLSEVDPTYILNFALRNKEGNLPYLTNDGAGSFTLRILSDTPGEILGFRSAPYLDKQGSSLENPGGDTELNKTYIKLTSSTGITTTQDNHVLASNPYTTLGDPPTEVYPGENSGTTVLGSSSPALWESGTDKLRWVDAKTVQWGVVNGDPSRGLRFYLSGCDYSTIVELSVGEFKGDSSNRLKAVWFGSKRVCFFGFPGDKVRWYMTHRCGEPIPYIPAYGETESPTVPAQGSPLVCLGQTQNQPPTVTITSCPSTGGGGASPLTLGTPEFSSDCCGYNQLLTCVFVVATVSGGVVPLQASCTVQYPGTTLTSGPTVFQSTDQILSFEWSPAPATISAPITTTVTVTDSTGATQTMVETVTSYSPLNCPDT